MSAAARTRDLVVAQSRALKLPGIARAFESLARQARDAHWPHEDYLHEVLSAEQASRHESVIRQRLREARFPEVKTLDIFDFTAAEGINATQIHALARGEWVTAPENLIFAGPIGTGKSHLATALGVEATKQRRRVLFTRAADLVRQLLEACDARELTRLQQRLLRVDVLIIDELGFVPFDRVGSERLFNVITDRYERRATMVTTNLAFAEWVTVFAGDEELTTIPGFYGRGGDPDEKPRGCGNDAQADSCLSSREERRMTHPQTGSLSERRTGLLSERRLHPFQ